jgi:translation elongation factor EF-Tu-like GTPase
MDIEECFIKEGFTFIVGKIKKGTITVNQEVSILGSGKKHKAVVADIIKKNEHITEAQDGEDAAILLSGIKKDAIKKGTIWYRYR